VLRGRPASGRRYCVNAAALRFVPLSLGNDAPALLSSAGSSRVRSSCSSNAKLVSDSVAPPVAGMRTEEETYASFQERSTACDPVIRALAEAHMECTEVAIFAAGCFWSLELLMARVPGVLSAESGYAGLGDEWRSRGKVSASSRGKVPQLDKEVNAQGRAAAASPTVTYEEVCGGATGLAEAVRVRYDPRVVRFAILAELFLGHIGPKITSAGIGDDPLYAPGSGRFRSAFFHEGTALDHDGTEDRSAAALQKAILSAAAQLGCKADDIAVEVVTGERKRTAERGDVLFFPAEDYHQRYLAKNQGADETKTRFGVLQHELPAKPQEVA
jgi:peptide methionine sulfoxide reductase MsrA